MLRGDMKHKIGMTAKKHTRRLLVLPMMDQKKPLMRTTQPPKDFPAGKHTTLWSWIISVTLVCRCFFDKGNKTHPLVFNDRESAAPGTVGMPKLCGRRTGLLHSTGLIPY